MSALRFFYQVTCPNDTVVTRLPYGKRPKRLVPVRSREEVGLLLTAIPNRVVRQLLRTIYAAGLRLSEALHLTAEPSLPGFHLWPREGENTLESFVPGKRCSSRHTIPQGDATVFPGG